MRNLTFLKVLLLSFVLCTQNVVAQTYRAFTETTVLFTNQENLEKAYKEGWCTDGAGGGTFSFANKSVIYDDPITGEEVSQGGVSLLGLKGLGGTKGAIFYATGVAGLDVCFRSGSTVDRFVKVTLTDSSNNSTSFIKSHNGSDKSPVIKVGNLIPTEKYTVILSGWAEEAATSGADCQSIYVKFEVTSNDGKPRVAYVYDSSYSTYPGILADPVYSALSSDYEVIAYDVRELSSVVGAACVEQLKAYDLVVLSEAVSGTHLFGLACVNLVGDVPVLNTKAFYYSSGRWGWATPVNPTKGASGWNQVKVAEEYHSHPLFRDVAIGSDGVIALFDGTATSSNNVQGFNSPLAAIASDKMLAKNGADGSFAIHEHTQANGENSYIMMALSTDAITTITDEAIKMISNSAEYLISTKGEYILPESVCAPVIEVTEDGVTITSSTPDATIYYALDASAKSGAATLYKGTFKPAKSGTLYAVAICDGMLPSEEVSEKVTAERASMTTPTLLDPEKLDRGVVAYKVTSGNLVSWRLLGTDDLYETTFNVYRDGAKINDLPLQRGTNYLDKSGATSSKYAVETMVGGIVTETSKEVEVWQQGYLNIALDRPASSSNASGDYYYVPGDASVGDVDGDGKYEIILKWDPSNQQDNSLTGYTGNVYIDCYKLDGTKLWRIDLGRNIRAGAHYTQFMVYDFDGDGKAEIACKTAPGTIDGKGNYVLMDGDNPDALYLGTSGKTLGVVTSGPEYLTMFRGETGEEITTVAYEPARGSFDSWGDNYGNRSERYLACVAYLDGVRPSLVMCRGYYMRASLTAYDFDGKNLVKRWMRDDKVKGQGCYGEGAHSLCVGDVDGDGCDEIIFGSACVNNDGTMLHRTGFGHGDALHLGDFDPDRPGLEIFMVHEEKSFSYPWDTSFRDAETGEVIWGLKQTGSDIGRGLCADIDSTTRGVECWPIKDFSSSSAGENSVFDCQGNKISAKRPSVNFRVYWMDNIYEQVLEKGKVDRWVNTPAGGTTNVVDFVTQYGCGTNLIKETPNLQADIFGDWREEIVLYDMATMSNLMIFPSPYHTNYRIPTLMHDHTYRMAICWQNVAYNQPPHLGYYLPDYAEYVNGRISTGLDQILQDSALDATAYFEGGILKIEVKGMSNDEVAVVVYNVSGNVVAIESGCVDASGVFALDGLDSFAQGVYMVRISKGEDVRVLKLMK